MKKIILSLVAMFVSATLVAQNVTSVTLDCSSTVVSNNSCFIVGATITPTNATDKKVFYESSDPTIASIDQTGRVSTKKVGLVTLKVTTNDGAKVDTKEIFVANIRLTAFSLRNTTQQIYKGEKWTLEPIFTPTIADCKVVKWRSDNTSIATVNEKGIVTGGSAGTVKITATSFDGEISAFCNVEVLSQNYVAAERIELDATTKSAVAGTTYKINATITPSNATRNKPQWKSCSPKIATVDQQGNVTLLSPHPTGGSILITAYLGDLEVRQVLTVTGVAVESVALSSSSVSVAKGGNTNLTATIAPSNASNKDVIWVSSDPSVATVQSTGQVTGVNYGIATITAITLDGEKRAQTVVNVVSQSNSAAPFAYITLSKTTFSSTEKIPLMVTNLPEGTEFVDWKLYTVSGTTVSNSNILPETALQNGEFSIAAGKYALVMEVYVAGGRIIKSQIVINVN